MARVADAAVLAFQTLTRFPTPALKQAPDKRTVGLSGVFYPLAGAAVGAAGCAVMAVGSRLGLSEGVFVVAGWKAMTLATGALHEDGLADTADALGSQRTVEDRLRVLKDSRIGTYGACGLILLYLFRVALTLESLGTWQALIAAAAVARAGAVALAWRAGPAGSGMGGGFAAAVEGKDVVGALLVAALTLPLAPTWAWGRWALGVALAFAAALLAAPYFRKRLGGVVGDSLGAYVVLAELLVLAAFAAV